MSPVGRGNVSRRDENVTSIASRFIDFSLTLQIKCYFYRLSSVCE